MLRQNNAFSALPPQTGSAARARSNGLEVHSFKLLGIDDAEQMNGSDLAPAGARIRTGVRGGGGRKRSHAAGGKLPPVGAVKREVGFDCVGGEARIDRLGLVDVCLIRISSWQSAAGRRKAARSRHTLRRHSSPHARHRQHPVLSRLAISGTPVTAVASPGTDAGLPPCSASSCASYRRTAARWPPRD